MAARLRQMLRRLRQGWRLLRQLSGDDAYERYLAHHAEAHPGQAPLSRTAYFRRCEQDKWYGVRRCC